jgi:hypothetical protein
MRSSYLRTILGAVAAFAFAAPAMASPITYTEVGTGSGTLDGTMFTNQLVTITMPGDTTNITNPNSGFFQNLVGTTTVTVATVGTDTLPTGRVFVVQTSQVAGFEDTSLPEVIMDTSNSAFATYALGAIGPTSGASAFNVGPFATGSGKTFTLSAMGDTTFSATTGVSAVPLPAALPLFASGLGALGLLGWRRKRKALAA